LSGTERDLPQSQLASDIDFLMGGYLGLRFLGGGKVFVFGIFLVEFVIFPGLLEI
jgi:hypothetical protein